MLAVCVFGGSHAAQSGMMGISRELCLQRVGRLCDILGSSLASKLLASLEHQVVVNPGTYLEVREATRRCDARIAL